MQTPRQSFVAAFFLGLAWYFFFWNEKQGLNVLLFFLLAISLLLLINPWMFRLNTVKLSFISSLILSLLVTLFNSDVSIISFWITLAVLTGFIHQSRLRSVQHALVTSSAALIASPANLWDGLRFISKSNPRMTAVLKYLRLSLIPLMVLFLFFILYSFSDPEFNLVTNTFMTYIFDWWWNFFDYTPFDSVLFFCSGLLIASAIVINRDIRLFVKHESLQSDYLIRRKRKRETYDGTIEPWQLFFRKTLISLKSEYMRAIIMLTAVNALLLIVNMVDIKMVWLEHDAVVTPHGRSQAVHETTYLLIFSILLAMAILIFFFRGNINFLKRNRLLKQLAFLWIIQNAFLALTAGIRNYYYIRDYGLAYHRIGIVFFLLLTLFGLLTLYVKIRDKKSFFYLYRINGWACCFLLLLMSCFNWDPLIASYNLTHFTREKLDRKFLMSLSDRALPTLIEHKEIFIKGETEVESGISKQEEWLKDRSHAFMESYKSTSWLSWNYADFHTYHFLSKQNQSL